MRWLEFVEIRRFTLGSPLSPDECRRRIARRLARDGEESSPEPSNLAKLLHAPHPVRGTAQGTEFRITRFGNMQPPSTLLAVWAFGDFRREPGGTAVVGRTGIASWVATLMAVFWLGIVVALGFLWITDPTPTPGGALRAALVLAILVGIYVFLTINTRQERDFLLSFLRAALDAEERSGELGNREGVG